MVASIGTKRDVKAAQIWQVHQTDKASGEIIRPELLLNHKYLIRVFNALIEILIFPLS